MESSTKRYSVLVAIKDWQLNATDSPKWQVWCDAVFEDDANINWPQFVVASAYDAANGGGIEFGTGATITEACTPKPSPEADWPGLAEWAEWDFKGYAGPQLMGDAPLASGVGLPTEKFRPWSDSDFTIDPADACDLTAEWQVWRITEQSYRR